MERQALNKKAYILAVLRRNPGEILEMLDSALTTFKYRYVRRCAGKNTVVRSKTRIINTANVRIADNCFLQDSIYIRAGAQGKVVLKEGCLLNSFSRFFGHGGIEIGENTQIGPGVTITTTDHNYEQADLPEIFKKVTIGKHAWIGANVTILPGVTIGDNAVIGAGSVVTKDIPSNSVAVGVPARVIKELRSDEPEGAEALTPESVGSR